MGIFDLGFEVWLRFGISFFYFVFVCVVPLFWILNGEVWCEKGVRIRMVRRCCLFFFFFSTLALCLAITWPLDLQIE